MIKVGIVDDHAIVRSGLKQFFSEQVDLRVVGEAGALRVDHHAIEITDAGGHTRRIEVEGRTGVQNELAAFAAAIRNDEPHINTPAEGVQDVAVIEAMIRAAQSGQRVAPERMI
jgi:predicted dehydrogenase